MELSENINWNEIEKNFGTPVYVYDTAIIDRQIKKFRSAFKNINAHLKYAVKSCSNISILKYMQAQGLGLDTVSIPEIKMGLELGFKPSEMVFTPNIVSFEEVRDAVDIGVPVNIENLQNLESFGIHYGNKVGCCIRLNPNLVDEVEQGQTGDLDFSAVNKEHYDEVDSEKVSAWHNQSKFGISMSQYDLLLQIIEKYDIRIEGVHLHSSHVILNKEVFVKGVQTVFEIASKFKDLRYVDFGGGIMVKHKADDVVIELDDVGPLFEEEYKRFCERIGKKIEVWFEPGRFLISEAGFLLTKTTVLKTNGHIDFVGVDTGFNHLLRPMMYNAYHEITNISNPKGELKQYNIVGNLCEIDNLGTQRILNEVSVNDLLVIHNAGAYGFSMSSNYNSKFKPAEVLIHNKEAKLIRKRQSYNDLLANQIEIDF